MSLSEDDRCLQGPKGGREMRKAAFPFSVLCL